MAGGTSGGRARVRPSTDAEIDAAATPVEQEARAEEFEGVIEVPLKLDDDSELLIAVPPREEWRDSALQALSSGQFSVWAAKTLDPDDYEAWVEADPRVRQITAFFEEFGRLSGVSLGKSSSSGRSSRSTRRR